MFKRLEAPSEMPLFASFQVLGLAAASAPEISTLRVPLAHLRMVGETLAALVLTQ